MGRRKRQSNAEHMIDAIALLPWWAGVVLALVSWLFFRSIANGPLPTLTHPNQIDTGFFLSTWFRGISTALQYAAPLLLLAGAFGSFLRRRKRANLLLNVTGSKSAEALDGISWSEFELLVGEAFRLQGFAVQEQGGAGPDGGVDLIARKGSETFLIQCKQWRAFKVGVDVVRELYGVMAARGAAGGYVVTSGTFTADAVAFAAGRNVRLVDGTKLAGLLQQARASLCTQGAAPSAAPIRSASDAPVPAATQLLSCPLCKSRMVRRMAKKGPNAGNQFWGCSAFPACRGTL